MSRMQGKALPKGAQAPNYAGIDVCKDWLDAKLRPSDKAMRLANDASGHKRLSRFMADNGVVLLVMEATGKYHRAAQRSLYANGFAVAVVNPKRARSFAESIGALAKTDEVDASVLAMMGEMLRPDATPPASKALGKMQELVRARQAALADRTAMQNRMGESTCDAVRESLNAVIEAINSAVAKLDAEIAKLIAGDGGLSRRMEILVSIPGVGPVTAASLIADLPELGECDDKAIAALVGVAPFAADSGDFRGQRRIRGGRSALRSTVYMAAVAAARSNPDMKRVYERLKTAGKASKVALTAVMRKLVILANALVKTDRKWTPRTA